MFSISMYIIAYYLKLFIVKLSILINIYLYKYRPTLNLYLNVKYTNVSSK